MSDPYQQNDDFSKREFSNDELLSGLWWDDDEFCPAVSSLWRDYVKRKREWDQFESEVATALRHLLRVTT